MKERVDAVLAIADANEDVRVRYLGTSFWSSYRPRELSEGDDAAVRGIIEELRARLNTDASSLRWESGKDDNVSYDDYFCTKIQNLNFSSNHSEFEFFIGLFRF